MTRKGKKSIGASLRSLRNRKISNGFTLLEMLISLTLCFFLLLFLYKSYAFVAREFKAYNLQKEKRITSILKAKLQKNAKGEETRYFSEFLGKVVLKPEGDTIKEEVCFP